MYTAHAASWYGGPAMKSKHRMTRIFILVMRPHTKLKHIVSGYEDTIPTNATKNICQVQRLGMLQE